MKKMMYPGQRMSSSKAIALFFISLGFVTASVKAQLQPVYYSSFGSSGSEYTAANPSCLLALTNANITNPANTATAPLTDFAVITTPVVGLTLACPDGYVIRTNLNLKGLPSVPASPAEPYYAGFHIRVSSLALLSLLGGNNGNNLRLITYLDGVEAERSTGIPIGLSLLTPGVEGNVYFPTTQPFNQVEVELSNSLLTLGAIESIRFYYGFASGRPEPVLLPVKLTSFSAAATARNVTLSWATTSETNLGHYELERSNDGGTTFSTVAIVAGKGSATTEARYSYTDGTTLSGSYTYRLKMIDKDGKTEYSKMALVKMAVSRNWKVYPTVLSGGTDVNVVLAETTGKTQVQLSNLQGQLVRTLSSNASNKIPVSTNGLSAGVYILKLYSNGQFQTSEKIVIQ